MSVLRELTNLYIPSIHISDIFEIAIIIFVLYKVINSLKNTRAMVVLKGILVLFIFYNIAYLFSFEAIVVLFQSAITILIFALIVVFQPEMRRFLEQIGTKNITGKFDFISIFHKGKEPLKYYSDKTIAELTKACFSMGSVKTGALIVIERDIPLTEYINTGISLNADLTSQLLINIFEKNTPLHDGAIVQVKDKVVSATCYLPLSSNANISKNMGTRHRAAIGVSEVTDCIVIVVSEETGKVSIVENGKIESDLTKERLTELLYEYRVKNQSIEKIVEGASQDYKEVMKNWVKQDKFSTLVVSVLIGLVGWVLLMNVANPITTRTIENVPIEYINTSVIEGTGKTFEVLSENTVDVTITDERSIVDNLTLNDISVIADFSKLSYVNAVPLTGFVEKYPSTVVKFIDSDTINLELDSVISKEVSVELVKKVDENSQTFVPVLNSEIDTIIVTGGKSKVDTIDKIVCTYDVSNAVNLFEGVSEPVAFDRNGTSIPSEFLTFSVTEVKATGIAYNIKSIPIDIKVNQETIQGYSISNVDFTPKTIKIAGDSKYLNSINKLTINMDVIIDTENISNNQFVKTINVGEYLPEGVYYAETNDEISVTLDFEALKSKTISFTKSEVSILGNVEDFNVLFGEDTFSIIISGDNDTLNKISKETIIPFIDISNLPEGKYNMIIQFEGLDNVILSSNISVSLEIKKK